MSVVRNQLRQIVLSDGTEANQLYFISVIDIPIKDSTEITGTTAEIASFPTVKTITIFPDNNSKNSKRKIAT